MFSHHKFFPLLAAILVLSGSLNVTAQDQLSWLNDYTDEMAIGNDTCRYSFSTVDGDDCKVKFKELLTDQKGSTDTRSWIFYLSDIDPLALYPVFHQA